MERFSSLINYRQDGCSGGGNDLAAQLRSGQISWAEYQNKINAMEAEIKNKPKRPLIHEHLNDEQTAALDRQRRRNHPTCGSTSSIPDRWSTTGTIKKPGE